MRCGTSSRVDDDSSEFVDTAMLPVVDRAHTHAEGTSSLLVTQSSADDQANRRLLVPGEQFHRSYERFTANQGHLRTGRLVDRAGSWGDDRVVAGSDSTSQTKFLVRTTNTLLSVVRLADEVLTNPKEVTHGDLAIFEILDLKHTKKHLLREVFGPFRGGQTTQKREHASVIAVEQFQRRLVPGGELLRGVLEIRFSDVPWFGTVRRGRCRPPGPRPRLVAGRIEPSHQTKTKRSSRVGGVERILHPGVTSASPAGTRIQRGLVDGGIPRSLHGALPRSLSKAG
ncbi:MAG: hypothetical protein VX672_07415 [Planctomycetota bacterium]|nr:hypothetical protein [Planctomycetota bacterium]